MPQISNALNKDPDNQALVLSMNELTVRDALQPYYHPTLTTPLSRCPRCGECFELRDEVDEHFAIEHPKCRHCKVISLNQDGLDAHIRRHHPSCGQCQQVFRTQALLSQHKSERLRCRICRPSSLWCDSVSLNDHQRKEHVFCYDCAKWFSTRNKFALHESKTHPTCDKCQIRFETSDLYSGHGHNCFLCAPSVWYCALESFVAHRQTCHTKCRICEDWLADSTSLKAHEENSHPPCNTCGTRWNPKVPFGQHEYCYCSLCPTPTTYCSNNCFYSHQQNDHNKCPTCNEWFVNWTKFKEHEDANHPTCGDCGTRFSTEDSYNQHYQWCKLCTSAPWFWYCTANALSAHQKSAHIKCTYCTGGKANFFKDSKEYNVHLAKKHPNR